MASSPPAAILPLSRERAFRQRSPFETPLRPSRGRLNVPQLGPIPIEDRLRIEVRVVPHHIFVVAVQRCMPL
jgi:hypothetical protein